MFKYIKYSLFHVMGLTAAILIILGGDYIAIGLVATLVIFVIGDLVLGEDTSTPEFEHPKVLTWQLWLALPLLCLIVFASLWQFGPSDLFNFGDWLDTVFATNLLATRGTAGPLNLVACLFLTGFYVGMIGTVTAHELTHRTKDPVSMTIGRWLLAFSFDSNFSIEHVYGHHRYVSTENDPATAPRGRNVYAHVLISTYEGNINAWEIEKQRLIKNNLSIFSLHNRAITGYLMSVSILITGYLMAGSTALLILVISGLWGKSLLEIVNYMEHYGIVRHPKTRVHPRHSWNTTKRVSSWAMFNLTRHSHHHAKATVPFHDLEPMKNSPEMISGYLGTIIIAMIPPLWHKLMTPRVLHWDENFATEEEKILIRKANQKSGLKMFKEAII